MQTYKYIAAPVERELTEAVRRVRDRYGSDLPAYFRHVQEVAKKNAQEHAADETVDSGSENESAA